MAHKSTQSVYTRLIDRLKAESGISIIRYAGNELRIAEKREVPDA